MSLDSDLRTVIARLELCSHVSAMDLDPSSRDSGEDVGGKRPSGGVDREDDGDRELVLKSAEHFRRRLAGAYSERTLVVILHDAEAALEAHRKQPPPQKDNEPEFGSSQWKRYIGESTESYGTLAARFGVERSYIQQVRKKYRSDEAA